MACDRSEYQHAPANCVFSAAARGAADAEPTRSLSRGAPARLHACEGSGWPSDGATMRYSLLDPSAAILRHLPMATHGFISTVGAPEVKHRQCATREYLISRHGAARSERALAAAWVRGLNAALWRLRSKLWCLSASAVLGRPHLPTMIGAA